MSHIKFTNSKIMQFIRREKRFLAYMNYNGVETEVYCCNSGRMADILIPGSDCIVTEKTTGIPYEWQAININNTWIGVNTANPNKLVELLLQKLFPMEEFRREVLFGGYKADFASKNKIIEVKNVHWKVGDVAYFPDCVTTRGARQILDLINLSENYECFVIYILQRNDVFQVSSDSFIDKKYYENVLKSYGKIHYLAFNCNITTESVFVNQEITYILKNE